MTEEYYRKIFCENLNYYMEKNDLKQIDLVRHFHLSKSTVSSWCSGAKIPRMDKIEMLAEYMCIKKSDLIEERSDRRAGREESEAGGGASVPVVGEVAAGYGAYADNEVTDRMELPKAWLGGGYDHVLLKVKGDSMEPEIHEGDLALIRCEQNVERGSLGVALIDDESGLIKRVMYGKNWIELQSLNPIYAPRRFEGEEMNRVRIFGSVRKIIRSY